MPLTPAFTVVNNTGSPTIIKITDTSTGSDVAVTQRRVYLIKRDDTYLKPTGTVTDYIAWPLVDTFINISALDVDYALNIRVDWLNVSNTVLYTLTTLTNLPIYSNKFFYELIQFEASIPEIIDDDNFFMNKVKLYCNIVQSGSATLYNDIFSAQASLNRAAKFVNNPSLFY